MLVPPAEYDGQEGTAVAGMVQQTRYVEIPPKAIPAGSGGKSGGKGAKAAQPKWKFEAHLGAGATPTPSNVVYMEAWGDAAHAAHKLLVQGKPFSVEGATMVSKAPQYSPSRLTYWLKLEGPLGIKTVVKPLTEDPWISLPKTLPTVPVASLNNPPDTRPVCVCGVLVDTPVVGPQSTPYGSKDVANFKIQYEKDDIRCAFWGAEAALLAQGFSAGDFVFLECVVPLNKGLRGWELGATKATRVELCESVMRERVTATTLPHVGSQEVKSLSTQVAVDYSTCKSRTVTMGALLNVPATNELRDLGKEVYRVHDLTIMGISGTNAEDKWQLISCKQCKKQVSADSGVCSQHPVAGTELRWILSLALADGSGTGEAMIYHDTVQKITRFSSASSLPLTTSVKRDLAQWLRAVPWSAKFVFKADTYKKTNTLEIRWLEEVLDRDSAEILESWTPAPPALQKNGLGVIPSGLEKLGFDTTFGHMLVSAGACAAVRTLVSISKQLDEDACVVTDPASKGLRVTKDCTCSLDGSKIKVSCAGLPSQCNWLNKADEGDLFLCLCTSTSDNILHVKAHHKISSGTAAASWQKYMKAAAAKSCDESKLLSAASVEATPTQKKRALDKEAGPAEPDAKGRKLFA